MFVKLKKTLIVISVAMFVIATSVLFPLGGVSKAKATATYGSATVADLLSGKTATVDAGQITGTMPNKVGTFTVITPGTADQAILQGYYDGTVAAGKVLGDSNLTAANILNGKSIFGLAGTVCGISAVSAGDSEIFINNKTSSTTSTTMVPIRSATLKLGGTIRVKFTAKLDGSTGYTGTWQVYKNGTPVGTMRTLTSNNNTPSAAYSEDFSVNSGDVIAIYAKTSYHTVLVWVTTFSLCQSNTTIFTSAST